MRRAASLPLLLACSPAFAGGLLDPSFGGDGIVIVDNGAGAADGFYAGLIDAQGRPVAAGLRQTPDARAGVLVRLLANGAPDPSFGAGGRVLTLPEEANSVQWNALAELDDGRLIVGGRGGYGFQAFLCLFHADGTPDDGFGKQGCLYPVIHPDSVADNVEALALQPDGRIVFVGSVERADNVGVFDTYVARIDDEGNYDRCFFDLDCQTGGVRIAPGGPGFNADNLALAPDGRILLAGRARDQDAETDMAAVRLLPTGYSDDSFNGDGLLVFDIDDQFDDSASDLVVLPDNRVRMVGVFGNSGNGVPGVGAATANGLLDGPYGTDLGRSSVLFDDVSPNQIVRDAELLDDGSLLFTGYSVGASASNCAVVRLDPAGEPDPRFGVDGVRVIDAAFGQPPDIAEFCSALDVRDESIVLFGFAGTGDGQDGYIARLDLHGLFRNGFED